MSAPVDFNFPKCTFSRAFNPALSIHQSSFHSSRSSRVHRHAQQSREKQKTAALCLASCEFPSLFPMQSQRFVVPLWILYYFILFYFILGCEWLWTIVRMAHRGLKFGPNINRVGRPGENILNGHSYHIFRSNPAREV